jgi:hypothetical protein
MVPPMIRCSIEIENREEARVGETVLMMVLTICARPLVAPKDALDGAQSTMKINEQP